MADTEKRRGDRHLGIVFKPQEAELWVPPADPADPGGPGVPDPLTPEIFLKSCSFQAILRGKPILSKFWVQAPLGVKPLLGTPWPKSWILAWAPLRVFCVVEIHRKLGQPLQNLAWGVGLPIEKKIVAGGTVLEKKIWKNRHQHQQKAISTRRKMWKITGWFGRTTGVLELLTRGPILRSPMSPP